MGSAAARAGDPTQHGIPLNGVGCLTVLIGKQPAWRAVTPGATSASASAEAAASNVRTARQAGDQAIAAAEAATASAVSTGVGVAAAQAAEQATKAATATSVGATITSAAASITAAAGSPPDIQTCPVPLPTPPHGPGLVLSGSTSVFIGGYAAARVGDQITEAVGPPNSIEKGEPSVQIG